MTTTALAAPIFESTDLSILPCGVEYAVFVPLEKTLGHARSLGELIRQSRNLEWFVGDLLNASEGMYGEEWAQVSAELEACGISIKYQKTAMWISGQFPPVHRNAALTCGHHKSVVKLIGLTGSKDDGVPYYELAVSVLRKAEENGWSAAQLREYVKERYLTKPEKTEHVTPEQQREREYETQLMTARHAVELLVDELEQVEQETFTKDEVVELIKKWRP